MLLHLAAFWALDPSPNPWPHPKNLPFDKEAGAGVRCLSTERQTCTGINIQRKLETKGKWFPKAYSYLFLKSFILLFYFYTATSLLILWSMFPIQVFIVCTNNLFSFSKYYSSVFHCIHFYSIFSACWNSIPYISIPISISNLYLSVYLSISISICLSLYHFSGEP